MAQFSRSNVSDAAFSKGRVDRSSYNLNVNSTITPKLGAFHPVRCTRLMPNTVVSGSVNPRLQLEKVLSPQIGRTRLDTHTFVVPFRRICNDFKLGVEKQNFSDGKELKLGEFSIENLWLSTFTSLFFYQVRSRVGMSNVLSLSFPKSIYDKIVEFLDSSNLPPLCYVSDFDTDSYMSEYLRYIFIEDTHLITYREFIFDVLDHIRTVYALYAFDENELFMLNYPKDFYANEYIRLTEYLDNLRLLSTDDFSYMDVLRFILEPYFGINSNFDYLGYPILRKYDRFEDLSLPQLRINDYINPGSISINNRHELTIDMHFPFLEENHNFESFMFFGLFLYPFTNSFSIYLGEQLVVSGSYNPFKLYNGIFNDFSQSGEEFFGIFQLKLPLKNYSDFPLRAAYSCWFDRMRDWHIENRSNCLDPDTFTARSLFYYNQSAFYDGFNMPDNQVFGLVRSNPYVLCVPRQRFYADDALTTIKTDDKFRHIYAPIFLLDDIQGKVDTNSESVLNDIESLYLDSLAIAFPKGSLFTQPKNDAINVLRQDLTLAKRSGMLERWLARNYFTPDNYNGFISAHFDTDVSDLDMLISKYIGGSEQMISGEQKIADVTTDESVRGTRTFVGGVSSDSSFTVQVSDYSYLVSFVSIVPLVEYDTLSPAVLETSFNDLPSPEYANDTRIEARLNDFLRGFPLHNDIIGYVPRYYLDRVSLDSVHGRYLTDYRSYSWFRDWYNMTFTSGSKFGSHGFALTPYSLRINLSLDSFLGLARWDSIAYGEISLNLQTNVPLSAAVEII